jgi:hypothetical protein
LLVDIIEAAGAAVAAAVGSLLLVRGAVDFAASFAFRAANRAVTSSSLGVGIDAVGGLAAAGAGIGRGGAEAAAGGATGGGGCREEYSGGGAVANGTLTGASNALEYWSASCSS